MPAEKSNPTQYHATSAPFPTHGLPANHVTEASLILATHNRRPTMPSCAFSVHLDQATILERRGARSIPNRASSWLFLLYAGCSAGSEPSVSDLPKEVNSSSGERAKVVLAHVRVIDGTGAAAVGGSERCLLGGKIRNIERGATLPRRRITTVLDLHG